MRRVVTITKTTRKTVHFRTPDQTAGVTIDIDPVPVKQSGTLARLRSAIFGLVRRKPERSLPPEFVE